VGFDHKDPKAQRKESACLSQVGVTVDSRCPASPEAGHSDCCVVLPLQKLDSLLSFTPCGLTKKCRIRKSGHFRIGFYMIFKDRILTQSDMPFQGKTENRLLPSSVLGLPAKAHRNILN
jgi:hypothetical protein